MNKAHYRIHRMIQDLTADPAAAKKFLEDADSIFDNYMLDEIERQLLKDGSRDALNKLGVHPNLQMKYFKIRKAPMPGGAGAAGPLAYYLDKLGQGN